MKPQLSDFPLLQAHLERSLPGTNINLAAHAAACDIEYVVVESYDDDSAGLSLYTVAGGAVILLHSDTVLFPLAGETHVPVEVEKALARQLVDDGTRSGDDLEMAADQLRFGLQPEEGTRGFLDFLFGGGGGGGGASAGAGVAQGINAQLLQTCRAQVNVLSSANAAGTNHGRLACVWAVNRIFRNTTGSNLTSTLGTTVLYKELLDGKGMAVNENDLQPGDLVISPTTGGVTGHVGYVGEGQGGDRQIYSNSSSSAMWKQNYSVSSWRQRYVDNLGLKIEFFRLSVDSGSRMALSLPVSTATPAAAADRSGVDIAALLGGGSEGGAVRVEPAPEAPRAPVVTGLEAPAMMSLDERAAKHLQGIYASLARTGEASDAQRNLFGSGAGRGFVSEGDSWFDYSYPRISPSVWGIDLIDALEEHGHEVKNVADKGATLMDMAYGKDSDDFFDFINNDQTQLRETVKWVIKRRPVGFLLSGGGNDFAGPGFETYLMKASSGTPGLNEATTADLMNKLADAYKHIIQVVKRAAADNGIHADLPVFLHGYSYAFPDSRPHFPGVGPWLGPYFAMQGYEYQRGTPQASEQLRVRRAIITQFLDRFMAMLQRVQVSFGNIHIADFRQRLGTIGEWQNELHPTNNGFRDVGAIMDALIRSKLVGVLPDRQAFLPADLGGRSAPLAAAAPAADDAASDDQRRIESALIDDFAAAKAALEGGNVHAALTLALASENRAREDTSRRAAMIVAVTPAMAARDERRWAELWQGIRAQLRFAVATDATGLREGPAPGAPIAATNFAALKAEYESLWSTIQLRPERESEIRAMTNLIIAGRSKYEDKELKKEIGGLIPWYFIGIIHALEGSCRFSTHLHNGDSLKGRTVNHPANRPAGTPPFAWHVSAADALKMKGYHEVTDWSVPAMLWRWERYNGFGSRNKGINTPYLWSFSTHYTKGKYVADHVWGPDAVSKQVGAAVLLKSLVDRGEAVLP